MPVLIKAIDSGNPVLRRGAILSLAVQGFTLVNNSAGIKIFNADKELIYSRRSKK